MCDLDMYGAWALGSKRLYPKSARLLTFGLFPPYITRNRSHSYIKAFCHPALPYYTPQTLRFALDTLSRD